MSGLDEKESFLDSLIGKRPLNPLDTIFHNPVVRREWNRLIEERRRKDAAYLAAHPILARLLKAWRRLKWLFWRP